MPRPTTQADLNLAVVYLQQTVTQLETRLSEQEALTRHWLSVVKHQAKTISAGRQLAAITPLLIDALRELDDDLRQIQGAE